MGYQQTKSLLVVGVCSLSDTVSMCMHVFLVYAWSGAGVLGRNWRREVYCTWVNDSLAYNDPVYWLLPASVGLENSSCHGRLRNDGWPLHKATY